MQFAWFVYVTLRIFLGPSVDAEPVVAPTVGEHKYNIAVFSDNPGMAIIGSEMVTQYAIRNDLNEDERKLTEQTPLYQAIEHGRLKRSSILSVKEVKKLQGDCLYLRGTTEVFNDPRGISRPMLQLHNGLYFVPETKYLMAKILLPVKGGYAAYYVPTHLLTAHVEETQDFALTTGACPDTMTPEKCKSCWPHAHHRPILLP